MSSRVTDATSRLEGRRRRGWRRRMLVWGSVALGVLLLGAGVWVALFSPLLAVTRVEVHGEHVLAADEVRQAAGDVAGTSLLLVDTAALAQRVAGLPPVAEVSVTRVWPDRLRVEVTEREPRLAISSGSGYLIADAAGVVFDSSLTLPGGLVPVDADPDDQQALVDAGTVFSSLSPATADKVARLEVGGRDSIALRLHSGARVFWGSAEDSALKAEVLEALLPLGGTSFDVSSPSHPTRR